MLITFQCFILHDTTMIRLRLCPISEYASVIFSKTVDRHGYLALGWITGTRRRPIPIVIFALQNDQLLHYNLANE